MQPPLLVEITRGPLVESRHRVHACIVDAAGAIVQQHGTIDAPVFPRSSVKALQALLLVESGAADHYGLSDAELALACASHHGEELHAETAASILKKAGQSPDCLGCGVQWPSSKRASAALVKAGQKPSAVHNNCSGKHAGFICAACVMGEEIADYTHASHPVQRESAAILEAVTGAAHKADTMGIDGCSLPTYAIPLYNLALGFARFGTCHGLLPERAKAAKRLYDAATAHPLMLAGTGAFDSLVCEALKSEALLKVGAEGVYVACLPKQGLGIALKCEDGTIRAAEVAIATLLQRFLLEAEEALLHFTCPILRNWNGAEVGEIKFIAPPSLSVPAGHGG